eukprot:m.249924 g.249924  ORF g.249924 m.249924 type:complete len:292 (-) comp15431_c0_seq5:211-1086(-)
MATKGNPMVSIQRCDEALKVVRTIKSKVKTCPSCQKSLGEDCGSRQFLRLWRPANGHEVPHSLVVKRVGQGWGEASTAVDSGVLHAGVTNRDGKVVSFDTSGLRVDDDGYEESIVLSLAEGATNDIDVALAKLEAQWTGVKYDPSKQNCFDFVIALLNEVEYDGHDGWQKVQFTAQYMVPLVKVAEMSSLCRAMLNEGNGFILHKSFTAFSCTLFLGEDQHQKQFESSQCPVCYDYQAFRQTLLGNLHDDSCVDGDLLGDPEDEQESLPVGVGSSVDWAAEQANDPESAWD